MGKAWHSMMYSILSIQNTIEKHTKISLLTINKCDGLFELIRIIYKKLPIVSCVCTFQSAFYKGKIPRFFYP